MKNKSRIFSLVAVFAVAVTFAACSDGENPLGQATVTPPEPIITLFEAQPPEIKAGESVKLVWKTALADIVEITGNPFDYHAELDPSGEVIVDGLTMTSDFTLTATNTAAEGEEVPAEGAEGTTGAAMMVTKQDPSQPELPTPSIAPESGVSIATKTITVTVISASMLSADITADSSSIQVGQSTKICWTVSPADAKTSITSSDGQVVQMTSATTPASGTTSEEEAAVEGTAAATTTTTTATPVYPAVGCTTVSPTDTTTYTVTATKDGETATDAVTIQVEKNINADIKINGMDNAETKSLTENVTVTWTVEPTNASVTITSEPSVTCEPALPAGVESASGQASCTLNSASTTFTIRAEAGTLSDTDTATATLALAGPIPLEITADPWAFESEEVEVGIKLGDAAANVDSVKIEGIIISDKTQLMNGVKQRVKVPKSGIKIETTSVGSTEPVVQYLPQAVVSLENLPLFHGGKIVNISKVAVDPNNESTLYYGAHYSEDDGNGAFVGTISIFKIEGDPTKSSESLVDIKEPIKGAFGLDKVWRDNNDFFSSREFPVGAIAVREGKPEWLFAGTTGLIMYSKDSGASWNRLDAIFYSKKDGYDGKTCAGKSQEGLSAAREIAALGQVCDLIAKEDGRLIVAYDRGIAVTRNVEEYLEDHKKAPWHGVPGADGEESAADHVFGWVAHDLEEGGGKIFAATNKGVYVNADGSGKSWALLGGGAINETTAVYSVAYDEKDGKLFAGTDTGVYSTYVGGDVINWVKTEGELAGPILSLVVDPYHVEGKSVVIAGTTTGIAVTRDGKTWSQLETTANLGEVRSVALGAVENGEKITYKVSAGGVGSVLGSAEVGATATPTPTPEPTPSPTPCSDPNDPNCVNPPTEGGDDTVENSNEVLIPAAVIAIPTL